MTNIKINQFKFSNLLSIEHCITTAFEQFKANQPHGSYEAFKNLVEETQGQFIFDQFPVAEQLWVTHEAKMAYLLVFINDKYLQDMASLQNICLSENSKINNIHTCAGDVHKGMSTAIVSLENSQKIVFKPTTASISKAFFSFLDWANSYYPLGNYRYQLVEGKDYHWLEFINQAPCQTLEEIKTYYERAGFMLGVSYVLNASDFHYENIIANGTTPTFIDHETIIQPKIDNNWQQYFKKFISEKLEDSVLAPMLLPIQEETAASMPVGTCGYGYHKQKSMQTLKKVAVDRFTDGWSFVTRFAEENFQKENIPTLNGVAVYPISHLEELLSGFEKCYALFLKHKTFLLTDKQSPLLTFENKTIRFIWRATNVYAKIQNQMKLPKNLVSHEHYEQKIFDYLFVAFKNVPKNSDLLKIHRHEVAHMLKGDIPFFEVNTSSRDLETDFGVIKDFFELNAIENTHRKLNKLSEEDLEKQIEIIKQSILS